MTLDGELDMASSPTLTVLADRVGAPRRVRVVLDLSALRFCDCAGLSALLRLRRQVVADGGWLRLCGATARMRGLLRLAGLTQALPCYPGAAQAFADRPAAEPAAEPAPSDRWFPTAR